MVLVDFIIVVGIGVFVVNVFIIDWMSVLQFRKVKMISIVDDDVELIDEEQVLLDQVFGKVLLFQFVGLMIFGVVKVIFCEYNVIGNCQVVVFDFLEVFYLGVIVVIVFENVVKEVIEESCQVFLVGVMGSMEKCLQKLKLLDWFF